MAAGVAEVLADCSAGEGGEILHGGSIRGGRRHDYGIVHGALRTQGLDNIGDRGSFLAHGYVDAVDGIALQVVLPLVDDGVNGYGGFAGLAVADNQLALSAAYRDHGVDSHEASLKRFGHGLTVDNARGLALERHLDEFAAYLAESVEGVAERVHDPAEHLLAHTDGGYAARPGDFHALGYLVGPAEENRAYVVFFEVHGDGHLSALELEEFARLAGCETMDADHAVADLQHESDLFPLKGSVDVLQLLKQNVGNLAGFNTVVVCH